MWLCVCVGVFVIMAKHVLGDTYDLQVFMFLSERFCQPLEKDTVMNLTPPINPAADCEFFPWLIGQNPLKWICLYSTPCQVMKVPLKMCDSSDKPWIITVQDASFSPVSTCWALFIISGQFAVYTNVLITYVFKKYLNPTIKNFCHGFISLLPNSPSSVLTR